MALVMMVALGTCGVASAMSHLVSITITPQWPATTDPGNQVLYTVTMTQAGEGDLAVALSCAGAPLGATSLFSVNPVRFTGNVPLSQSITLTLACTNLTATDAYPFTVTGTADRESVTATNQAAATFDAGFAANPASRPKLALDLLGKHNMKIRGKGATGKTYEIEVSQSLTIPAWGPMGATKADGNGRFTFMDSNAKSPDTLFYRSAGPLPK